MKSQAQAIVRSADNPQTAQLLLREYLQHLVLRQMFEQKLLAKWIFQGGTALRIVYGVNRFSEDLDFHLNETTPDFSLTASITKLSKNLQLQGYKISVSKISESNVRSAFIRFEGLPYELGLSPHANAKLSVKIEVDACPPSGFQVQQVMINRYFPYSIRVHDLPSFMAGKLHAILQRPYTKGRDYYDLIFLLSRWQNLEPNFIYLESALRQTDYKGVKITAHNWRQIIADVVGKANWKTIIQDVKPFLQSGSDLQLMTPENLMNLLRADRLSPL
jgi:predicted nucleotidyltransferase component of viral defense system